MKNFYFMYTGTRPRGCTKGQFDSKMKILLLSVVMMGISLLSRAQSNQIKGVVKDEQGSGLPGVSVVIKGTTNGTTTDPDGGYSLTAANDAVLNFSFIGFTSQEIPVNGQSVIDVIMLSDVSELGEVVIVGYGEQKKANVTGAVASVNLDDVKQIPAANTASLFQGRMAGVTVSNFTGQPGNDNPQIRIRGIGTFNAGAEPLIIVDGVQSQINQIPVNDIESVSVLKDAASAAIYGVRAANGVVIITTKRGKAGKTKVELQSNIAFQNPIVKPDFLDSWDWAAIKNEWNVALGGTPTYTDEQIQAMRDGSDSDHFANTDWWDEAFQMGVMQTYDAAVSGGNENARYRISAQYMDQEGVLIGTGADRASIRTNLDINATKKLKIGLNLYTYRRTFDQPSLYSVSANDDNSLIYSIRRFTQPTVPVKYSNGEWGFVDGATTEMSRNPVWVANTGFNETQENWLEGKLSASYEIVTGLTFTSSLSAINQSSINSTFVPTYKQFNGDGAVIGQNVNNWLSNSNSTFRRQLMENLLSYNKIFGRSNVGVLFGHTAQYERNDYMYSYRQNFPNNNIHELDAGSQNPQVRGNAYEVALQSFFGRVNYSFDDRYLFEANLRYDGSSRMPKDERYGLFPSVSAGWVLSNEQFLRDNSIVSFLKARVSWGTLGNQEIGNYTYTQNFAVGQNYIIGGAVQGGAAINDLANANISWETTTITDIGIDANFLNNRLQVTADYFNKKSSDILIRLPIPGTLGVNNGPYQNAAEVDNKGWELDVTYRDRVGQVGYTVGGNLSSVKNEIVDIAGLENWVSGNSINMVGEAIGAYYAYVSDGYYTEDELADAPTQFGTLRAGDIRYKDISGPEGMPDGIISADYDRKVIGTPFPKLTYAFNVSADWKGFDVSLFFQGISGIERYFWYNTENVGQFTSSILDYWTPENTDAAYPRFGNNGNNFAMSDFWLRDASYLRLKNIQVGYNFPAAITNRLSMQNLRVFFTGTNLVTFTDVTEYDPERPTGDERSRAYPGLKSYSFGVNLTF
jgi:TonB-dependent starch-binding outer membrane protein SusC